MNKPKIEVTPELIRALPVMERALSTVPDEVMLQFQMLQFQLLRDFLQSHA